MASVSTRFHPDEQDMQDADLILLATDAVFFYAHRSVLLRESSNNFGGLVIPRHVRDKHLPLNGSRPPDVVIADYQPAVLNVVLLAVYDFPMRSCDPTLETLCDVVPALTNLGYNLSSIAAPQSELFGLLLEAAEGEPFWLYAIAAQHDFEELAIPASRFTLGKSIGDLPNELAEQMGPIYLKRLLVLHHEHGDTLKRLVAPPILHPPTDDYPKCDSEVQVRVKQAWTVVSAHVVCQNDLSGIEEKIASYVTHVECPECLQSLWGKVALFIEEWSMVRVSV